MTNPVLTSAPVSSHTLDGHLAVHVCVCVRVCVRECVFVYVCV